MPSSKVDTEDAVSNKEQKAKDSRKPTPKQDPNNNNNNVGTELPNSITNTANNAKNNKEASSNPPDPIKQTKAQADKEQDKNPPTGPQKGPAGNVKPPPAQEQGAGSSNQASVGEAGDQDKDTNEKGKNELLFNCFDGDVREINFFVNLHLYFAVFLC